MVGQEKKPATAEPSGNGEDNGDNRGEAWESPTRRSSPRFGLTTSKRFVLANYTLAWLVKWLLVQGQPGVIAGPKKAMKTSLVVELAVSLATAVAFLGHFEIYQRRRVAIFSGESGPATLKETFLRVAKSKGIDPATIDGLYWGFELPQFTSEDDMAAFKASLEANQIEVVIVDPSYLCVLAGAGPKGPQASNAFQMGPLYKSFTDACLSVGATPILATHFRISRQNVYGEPELDDLTHAGIQEFVRQWILIARREKYVPGTGQHRLWLSVGGSAGQSGLWTLNIDEGVIDEKFGGRFWNTELATATEQRRAERSEVDEKRKVKLTQQGEADQTAIMATVDDLAKGNGVAGYTKVRDRCGVPKGPRFEQAIARLEKRGLLEDAPYECVSGTGGASKRIAKGLRRKADGE